MKIGIKKDISYIQVMKRTTEKFWTQLKSIEDDK